MRARLLIRPVCTGTVPALRRVGAVEFCSHLGHAEEAYLAVAGKGVRFGALNASDGVGAAARAVSQGPALIALNEPSFRGVLLERPSLSEDRDVRRS